MQELNPSVTQDRKNLWWFYNQKHLESLPLAGCATSDGLWTEFQHDRIACWKKKERRRISEKGHDDEWNMDIKNNNISRHPLP